jgi:hypothetical protein
MAFRGVYEAPELTPTPCGLLSVASVRKHTSAGYDEKWIRNFAHEFDSRPTVRLLTIYDDVVTNGTLFSGAGLASYLDYVPFFIEVEEEFSGLDALVDDSFATLLKQLEAATQKAVEVELWDGRAALGDSNANLFLSKGSTASILGGGPVAPYVGLYLLEQAISSSPTGENGVIHMTRDIASVLDTRLVREKCDGKFKIFTRLGTPVSVGSGYSGNGPIGDGGATASATNKWMYATSKVYVELGKSEIVNEDLAHGINSATNEIILQAVRPAAVYFDPSIHYAARVTIPTS